jgi:hypothetical protein
MTASATIPSGDVTGLGTMSTQNANAVAITGGTINGTTIGATTPSSIVGTTITGQTEVLRGTGNNLVLQSQTFNVTWNNQNLTIATGATTAPDSTNTGNSLIPTVSNAIHRIQQSFTWTSGIAYTVSIYAKANGYRYLFLNLSNPLSAANTFDLQTGTVVTASGGTASIVNAGNGWYRCVVTGTPSTTNTNNFNIQINNTTSASDNTFAGDGTSGIYLWGGQIEVGSTANTYIPTTTTAVYGTPTLSFSGVSTLGLESNGALFLQPAGTGAIQAQATTSTTAGGNARGANAVDWQTVRSAATHVASGAQSIVGGGAGNVSSSTYAIVAGGLNNNASGFGSIVSGGSANIASAAWTFVGASTSNTASGQYGSVVCGNANTASGFYGFVGNGFTNSTTANAAVTTQSGTMNATTAVTLSGSNANIKVGQYISGTSIAADTYVAAISGTSLTLSKNASGSSTSTLSFFTPHGVVVGGGNNQATGAYSAILGGGDAGTAANRNVASGDWSTVGGGRKNTASGIGSVVAGGGTDGANIFANLASGSLATISGGWNNTASAGFTTVAGGQSNISSGSLATIGGGTNNLANSSCSTVVGGAYGTTRAITGNIVFSANLTPISSLIYGASQSALLVLGVQTTDATATALRSDTGAAGTTNQVILPNNSAYFFTGEVISGVTGGGNTKGWTIEGVIKRGANAASTALVGTPTVTSSFADAGASTWTIAVTADTTNGGIRVTFTGQASTTIRTVCSIRSTEMTF